MANAVDLELLRIAVHVYGSANLDDLADGIAAVNRTLVVPKFGVYLAIGIGKRKIKLLGTLDIHLHLNAFYDTEALDLIGDMVDDA